jgi:hypothetical protein
MNKILLLIGGIVNLLAAVMHLTLPKASNWKDTLSSLSLDNAATMYTLNVHVGFTCLIFAYLTLMHRKEMLETNLGRAAMAGIALFWVLRAINQVLFYGLNAPNTGFWVIFCLIVSLLYVIPLFSKRAPTPIPAVG